MSSLVALFAGRAWASRRQATGLMPLVDLPRFVDQQADFRPSRRRRPVRWAAMLILVATLSWRFSRMFQDWMMPVLAGIPDFSSWPATRVEAALMNQCQTLCAAGFLDYSYA